MTFSTDKYFGKEFHIENYNCWDFIRDVWLELKGEDIGKRTPTPATRYEMKIKFSKEENHFQNISELQSPCIVLFKRDKATPHVGVFYNGKVLHLKETGVKYEDINLAGFGFTEIKYYICKQ